MSTLRNAAAVLRSFSADTPEVNVTAVADRLQIPKSTSSRLLKMMAEEGLLEPAGSKGRYRPGPLTIGTGQVFRSGSPVASRLDGLVADITKTYGGVGTVIVRDGRDVFPLMRHVGGDEGRPSQPMAIRTPAVASPAGRAMLARLSDSELKAMYRKGIGPGASSIQTIDQLSAELAPIRASGVSRTELGGRVTLALAVVEPFHDETWSMEYTVKLDAQSAGTIDKILYALVDGVSMIGARVGDRYWLDWKPSRLPKG
jgi:DNA-binding IclR family transcriptional regulator